MDTVKTVSIEELGGLLEIEDSFFYGSLLDDEIKYTYLETNDIVHVLINTIIVNYRDFSKQLKYTYVYDANTKQIVDKWETDGEF